MAAALRTSHGLLGTNGRYGVNRHGRSGARFLLRPMRGVERGVAGGGVPSSQITAALAAIG